MPTASAFRLEIRQPLWMGAGVVLLGCAPHVLLDSMPGGGGGGSGEVVSKALVTKTADPGGPCAVNPQLNPPDAVFVLAANRPITCAETLPSAFSATVCPFPFTWEVCVALSPSSLVVGTVDLTASGLNAEEEDVGSCAQDGSIFDGQGKLEITAVGTSSVTFALAGTTTLVSSDGTVDANGTYTAARCP